MTSEVSKAKTKLTKLRKRQDELTAEVEAAATRATAATAERQSADELRVTIASELHAGTRKRAADLDDARRKAEIAAAGELSARDKLEQLRRKLSEHSQEVGDAAEVLRLALADERLEGYTEVFDECIQHILALQEALQRLHSYEEKELAEATSRLGVAGRYKSRDENRPLFGAIATTIHHLVKNDSWSIAGSVTSSILTRHIPITDVLCGIRDARAERYGIALRSRRDALDRDFVQGMRVYSVPTKPYPTETLPPAA